MQIVVCIRDVDLYPVLDLHDMDVDGTCLDWSDLSQAQLK